MSKLRLLVIAIGLLLSTSYLMVQSLPIKYHLRKESGDKTPNYPPLQKRLEHAEDAGNGASELDKTMEWARRLTLGERYNKMQHPITRQYKIFPKAEKPTTAAEQSRSSSSSTSTIRETEMTVSIPRSQNFGMDQGPDEDENRKPYMRGNPVQPRSMEKIRQKEFSDIVGLLPQACAHKSTVYNFPKQMRYLKTRFYHIQQDYRPVWLDLREAIYTDGNSQDCHKSNMTEWTTYIHCAIRRNMRMEYLVPKYPLHQQGTYTYPPNFLQFVKDYFER